MKLGFEYFQNFLSLVWKSKFYHTDLSSIIESIIFCSFVQIHKASTSIIGIPQFFYIRILDFFGLLESPENQFPKTTPIPKKATLFLKNQPSKNWRVPGFWAFFESFENAHTWLWIRIIFLRILWSRNTLWFLGSSKMSISIYGL